MAAAAQSVDTTIKSAQENVETILESSPERHTLVWAQLLASILEASDNAQLTLDTCQLLLANTSSAALRLQICQILYNSLPDRFPERYALYCALLSFATSNRLAQVVVPTFPKVSAWIASGPWAAITGEQRRNVHTLMHTALLSLGNERRAYEALVEKLATYPPEDVRSGAATTLAVATATLAIRLPEVHQCDELLALGAVAHLAEVPEHATLHKLLTLFAHDDLAGYLAFHAAHQAELSRLGLSHEQCLQKIRLLSLTTIASHSRVVTYDAIARGLQIPAHEVEEWVVLAVANKLLDARMDQIQQTVTINQTNQRTFTAAHWKDLSRRLHLWRDNVAQCAVAFEQVQQKN